MSYEDDLYRLLQFSDIEILRFGIDSLKELNVIDRVRPNFGMSYIKEGNAVIRYKDRTYVTEPGTVAIFPPFEPNDHIITSEEPALFFWWFFKVTVLDCIDILNLMHLPITFRLEHHKEFESAFRTLTSLAQSNDLGTDCLLAKAKSLEIFAYLLEGARRNNKLAVKSTVPNRFLAMLNEIIKADVKSVSLKDLSEKYYLHPNYISNRFKYYFNTTPKELLHKKIIDLAKGMLTSSDLTITEIADYLGFTSLYSFSRFFYTHEGLYPLKYRKGKEFSAPSNL